VKEQDSHNFSSQKLISYHRLQCQKKAKIRSKRTRMLPHILFLLLSALFLPYFFNGMIVVVNSFCGSGASRSRFGSRNDIKQQMIDIDIFTNQRTFLNSNRLFAEPSQKQPQQQQRARRWNGNYKHTSHRLSDISKAKKLWFNVTANGITKTIQKKRMESIQHVLTKAVIWKLYMEEYPHYELEIELDIGDPDYLPDVVGFIRNGTHDTIAQAGAGNDDSNYCDEVTIDATTPATKPALVSSSKAVWTKTPQIVPLFWGESGRMKVHKAFDLMLRYPNAHIVHCRWGVDLDAFTSPFLDYIENQVGEGKVNDLSTWWNGTFSFASLPLDVWRFVNEEGDDGVAIAITREDLKWRDLEESLHRRQMESDPTDSD
jgi:hypothetical protein